MIIGLTGHKRSGKDLTCQIIKDILPQAERRAYADKLKQSAAALLGLTVMELEDWKTNKYPFLALIYSAEGHWAEWSSLMDFRTYLQRYGTEAHRDIFGEDFWLKQCLPWEPYDDRLIVVTDVRFDNEAYWIKDLGGEIWSLHREQNYDDSDKHPSEIPVSPHLVKVFLDNSSSEEVLRVKIQKELKRLGYVQ